MKSHCKAELKKKSIDVSRNIFNSKIDDLKQRIAKGKKGHGNKKGLLRIGQMYFGSQSVAEEQQGNEKKMWLAVRPIVNLQTLLFFLLHTANSIQLQQQNRMSTKQDLGLTKR